MSALNLLLNINIQAFCVCVCCVEEKKMKKNTFFRLGGHNAVAKERDHPAHCSGRIYVTTTITTYDKTNGHTHTCDGRAMDFAIVSNKMLAQILFVQLCSVGNGKRSILVGNFVQAPTTVCVLVLFFL